MIPNRGREFSCPMRGSEIPDSCCAAMFVRDQGSKIQEGWPLPFRNSEQTLDKLDHGSQKVSHLPYKRDGDSIQTASLGRWQFRSGDPDPGGAKHAKNRK